VSIIIAAIRCYYSSKTAFYLHFCIDRYVLDPNNCLEETEEIILFADQLIILFVDQFVTGHREGFVSNTSSIAYKGLVGIPSEDVRRGFRSIDPGMHLAPW
jgi:hypothetical protein